MIANFINILYSFHFMIRSYQRLKDLPFSQFIAFGFKVIFVKYLASIMVIALKEMLH